MNKYTDWLNLEFDPFIPGASSRDFYCSGHRQQLLDQIVELSLYSNAMIAVTGPIGSGKTTLATNFRDRFAEEAVCIKITATLFMNQNQFLEPLQGALPIGASLDIEAAVSQICHYAAELDLEARSLILIIDDAHELSAEVLELLTQLLERSVDSSIHALLFGESQLDNLLQSTLTAEQQERLAVFPLEGFASDETQEYIRFKLVTAGYRKDLPIAGGAIGAIHNASLGMPGSINSQIADALNMAAPIVDPRSSFESEEFGPMFSGERIEQADEFDDYDRDEDHRDESDRGEIQPFQLANVQPRYWAAAAMLVVLLTGTLLFWDASPTEIESVPIPVAVAPTAVQPAAIEPELDQLAGTVIGVEDVPPIEVEPAITNLAASTEDSTIEVPVEVAAGEIDQAAVQESGEDKTQEIAVAEAPKTAPAPTPIETPVLAEPSSFEERLLQAAPENFAVQLLASHSEANIRDFVAQLEGAGYFETRYQDKPWFVAVLAAFDNRSQATDAIAALPQKLRSNQPWIRSVAGIQTDIRKVMGSKLVSAQ